MSSIRRITRRDFLKATAVAVGAPLIIRSTALGDGATPAPSNRLTLAHIGIGNQGPGHFNAMLGNPETQILAVCDVKQTVRDKYQGLCKGKYGGNGCDVYNDFREVMDRRDIDAVVIAVPDHWHALIAIAAAKSGKDIYCEKPMALTIREARAMVNAVRRYGRVFQTGSQQRSETNTFLRACEMVRNERIGKLKDVYAAVGGPSSEKQFAEEPIPAGFDWEFWQGPAAWKPFNSERCSGNYGGGWRQVRDYSGGMMTDWGAHHFDISQWGIGADNSGPVEIHPPDDKDYPTLTYVYTNGVKLHHWFGPGTEKLKANLPVGKDGKQLTNIDGVVFVGEKGWVQCNRGKFSCFPEDLARDPIGPNDIHLYRSPGHHKDWLDCIKTRQRPICDVEVGCRSVSVCHLGNIAYWTNRSLKWDPAKEELIGDEEASRWLVRPMRAPWSL